MRLKFNFVRYFKTSERSHVEAENVKTLREIQDAKRTELKQIYDIYNELQKYINSLKKSYI